MTKKDREELRKVALGEFCVDDKKAEVIKGMREMKEYLELLQTEVGLTRAEAITFIATMGAHQGK